MPFDIALDRFIILRSGSGTETDPVFLASEAADFVAGDAAKLAGIEAGAEVNNITDVNATDLTDGGATTLHTHAGVGHDAVTLDVNADTLLSLSTQALGLDTQVANTVFAGRVDAGAALVPTFRALVAADIPALAYLADAASDGFAYGRKDATWAKVGGLALANTWTTTQTISPATDVIGLVINKSATANALSIKDGATTLLGIAYSGALSASGFTLTDATIDYTHHNILLNYNPSAASSKQIIGAQLGIVIAGANNNTDKIWGVRYAASHGGTGTMKRLVGAQMLVDKGSTGVITTAIGLEAQIRNLVATNAITNGYGFYINVPVATGAITNSYGLYIDNHNLGATLNYAIYTNLGLVRLGDALSVTMTADRKPLSVTGFTTQTNPSEFIDKTAATNSVRTLLKLQTESSGTSDVGLGAALDYYIQTATAATKLQAARIAAVVTEAAAATFKSKLQFSAYDTAARLGLEIEADGSAARIGFFGATPVVQQLAATDLGVALSNLGLRVAGTAYLITTSGSVTISDVNFTSSTPAALGGDVNDWNLGNVTFIRADGGAADRIITGIVARADGHLLKIHNVGTTNKLSFSNQSGSSSAANRLINANAGTTEIMPNHAIQYIYDATTARWREETHL
jgi:hypothetical protein